MRNHVLLLLVAILTIAGSLPLAAQTPEAYVIEKDGVLTFYYDAWRSSRDGKAYGMPTEDQLEPGWVASRDNVTQVTFDPSFADYRPSQTKNWFPSFSKLQTVSGITNLNTSEVTDMRYMFYECPALTELDLSSFDTHNVSNMNGMFVGDSALTSLNVSNFNTEKVTGMESMFALCSSLTELNLTSFSTQNVSNMNGMFAFCGALTTIYSNKDWKTDSRVFEGVNDKWMFLSCTQLKGAVAYSDSQTGIAMANPTTGYFTTKEFTGISNLQIDKASDNKTYDLNGRRVTGDYKGIVIKNGKKTLQH